MDLLLDRTARRLWRGDGLAFDAAARRWVEAQGTPAGARLSPAEAVRWLQAESGRPCRVPVGVVGARAAAARHRALAEELGTGLAGLGVTVLCGGREGVMEAVCRGVARAGGLSVGLLPGDDPAAANPHVGVPIATGIGVARNAVIARASLALVAIGGGHGTTAEVAFGLQFGVPVFGNSGAPELPGVAVCPDVATALEQVARVVLGLPLDLH